MRQKKGIPDCTKYSGPEKWSQQPRFGCTKAKKLRWLFHIIKESKTKPSPNAYSKFPKERPKGIFVNKETKTYIDEMMYRATATPPPYENVDSLILKSSGFKGIKFDTIKSDRFKKSMKNNVPGPGTYNHEEVSEWLRTSSRGFKLSKGTKDSFFVSETKVRSKIPPVGHYKNLDNAMTKISKHFRKPRR